jgi:hypothetical protein
MAGILCISTARTAFSQEHPAPGAKSSSAADLPDVLVLVEPIGEEANVAVTYSRAVSHADARSSLSRLAGLAGWKLRRVSVNDQELFADDESGRRTSLGKQTGIEATAANVAVTYGRAFRLQPFVEAYRDAGRLDLLFLMGGLNEFTGLRSYDDPALSVKLLQEGGPYRYRIEVRKRSGALPKLPLDEPVTPRKAPAAVQVKTESTKPSLGPVMVIAACAGLAAFAALRLLTAYNRRGRSRAVSKGGRALHSGPYIVSRRKD